MTNKNVAQTKLGIPVVLPGFMPSTTVATYTAFINAAYTSPTVNIVKVKRKFDEVKIKAFWGKGTAATSTTSNVTFVMPSGYTFDASQQPNGFTDPFVVGYAFLYVSATAASYLFEAVATSSTTVQFRRENNVAFRENLMASGDYIEVVIESETVEFAGGMTAFGAGRVTSVKDGLLQATGTLGLVTVQGANGYGSVNTAIRRFSNILDQVGSDITYADSATAGATFVINTSGVYAMSATDLFTVAGSIGISRNSAQTGTAIGSITAANRLGIGNSTGSNGIANCSITRFLNAGDVIRVHNDLTASGSAPAIGEFTIQRLS